MLTISRPSIRSESQSLDFINKKPRVRDGRQGFGAIIILPMDARPSFGRTYFMQLWCNEKQLSVDIGVYSLKSTSKRQLNQKQLIRLVPS